MYIPDSDALVFYLCHEKPTMSQLNEFVNDIQYLTSISSFKKVAINLNQLKEIDLLGMRFLLNVKKSLEQSGYIVVIYNLKPGLLKLIPASREISLLDLKAG